MRIRMALVAGCLVCLLPTAAIAEGKSGDKSQLAERLAALKAKREIALRDLERLPDLTKDATEGVLKKLKEFWEGNAVRKEFETHYAVVEKKLQTVGIRPAHNNRDVYWAMLKAPATETQLKTICSEFIDDVKPCLRPEQDKLFESLLVGIRHTASKECEIAIAAIREKVDKILATHFPAWQGLVIPFAAPRIAKTMRPVSSDSNIAIDVAGLVAGILMVVLRKALARIVQSILTKMVGKVLARLIPILGWILIALEVWNLAAARSQLEDNLRKTYLVEYKAQFTPDAAWKGTVEDIRARVQENLDRWEQFCREEAKRVLNVAEMLEAPGIREWLKEQEKKGKDLDTVLEQLSQVFDVFGPVALAYKIDLLIEMLAFAPDKGELRDLVKELGNRTVQEYERDGLVFLSAAHHIGPRLFLAVLNDPVLQWKSVYQELKALPLSSPLEEKTGVIEALRIGIDPHTLSSADRREVGSAPRETLDRVAKACSNRDKLRTIVLDRVLREAADALCKDDPDLAAKWLSNREPGEVRKFQDESVRKSLRGLFQLRKAQGGWTVMSFVAKVSERDIGFFREFGKDGIDIWDAYLAGGRGEHQESRGNRALELYRQGVVKDALLQTELLEIGEWCAKIPIVGIGILNHIYPFSRALRITIWILTIFIPLLAILACSLFAWRLIRRSTLGRRPLEFEAPLPAPVRIQPDKPIQVQLKVSMEPPATPGPKPGASEVHLLDDKTNE